MLLALAPTLVRAQSARPQANADSVSKSKMLTAQALADVLRMASEKNRLPADLIAYKANVETEVAVILRQEDGIETVAALEQIASTLRWTRAGSYDQHVVGYRAQQLGVSISMLSALREGWVNPVLYGNRLRARVNPRNRTDDQAISDRVRGGRSRRSADSIVVVHPLATDRDKYYVYSQGDTLVTLQSGARRIPIARVHVEPRADINDSIAVFVGDMDIDVSRGTLVKLRGYFARASKARHHSISLTLGEAIAFIEFDDAEYTGKYWLPAVQRVELQATFPVLGDGRAVLRIVSRFPEIAVNDTVLDSATIARADSVRFGMRRRLTYAEKDSLAHFSAWRYSLGKITAGLNSDDFDDIAPDRMRTTGAPRVDIAAPHLSDVLHFDRVEGWYTGLGVKYSLRDMAPGLVIRANGGYAWSEQTARGRVSVERTKGVWKMALHAGRSLDNTNDFQSPLDSAPAIASFGSDDPFDYVDRRSVSLGVYRSLLGSQAQMRVEFGAADDRYAPTTVAHGLFSKKPFLPNRAVDEGGYRRTLATFDLHPGIDAESIRPGYSARALYERGDGTLQYQRVELRATARELVGPLTWVVRGDVGGLFGKTLPTQQLFELGKGQNLPGYDTKEFAGTRAAVLKSNLIYTSRYFKQPIRLTQRIWLPALAPGFSVGVQSGWTDAPGDAARASVLRLGILPDSNGVLRPVSRVTDGVRATTSVGLRFFSGSVFVGFARPVERDGKWKFLFTSGRTL